MRQETHYCVPHRDDLARRLGGYVACSHWPKAALLWIIRQPAQSVADADRSSGVRKRLSVIFVAAFDLSDYL